MSLWACVLLFSGVQRLHQKPPCLLPDVTFELQRAQDHKAIKSGTDTKGAMPTVLREHGVSGQTPRFRVEAVLRPQKGREHRTSESQSKARKDESALGDGHYANCWKCQLHLSQPFLEGQPQEHAPSSVCSLLGVRCYFFNCVTLVRVHFSV